jgi:hypothetical protein
MNGKQFGLVGTAGSLLVVIFAALATFGINDNGYRTVVQLPNGHTFVKFEPGIYFDWFGSTWEYPDVVTMEFDDKGHLGSNNQIEGQTGIPVRYQDGGTGTVYGVVRLSLPTDEPTMLDYHKAFRSDKGARNKLFSPLIKEALNLTAGLLTSEEAYAEKRNEFSRWGEDQIKHGKYLTKLEERTRIVAPAELDGEGKIIKQAVTRKQDIPVIKTNDLGQPLHGISPLSTYGVGVTGFSLVDWAFEKKTLDQINDKREANMAIITSRANAAKAKQQKLQAIAEGEKNVATAKYLEEVQKVKQVVIAERVAEVAVIDAKKVVSVNEQNYLAQVQDVKAALEEAKAIEARTVAQADAKRRIMEADGALAQKLETYEKVAAKFAVEFGKQKWVPEMVMGSGSGAGASQVNAAQDMIQLLTAKTAKDLQLDMSMTATKRGRVAAR